MSIGIDYGIEFLEADAQDFGIVNQQRLFPSYYTRPCQDFAN